MYHVLENECYFLMHKFRLKTKCNCQGAYNSIGQSIFNGDIQNLNPSPQLSIYPHKKKKRNCLYYFSYNQYKNLNLIYLVIAFIKVVRWREREREREQDLSIYFLFIYWGIIYILNDFYMVLIKYYYMFKSVSSTISFKILNKCYNIYIFFFFDRVKILNKFFF